MKLEEKGQEPIDPTLSLWFFTVVQLIFLLEVDDERRWENPIGLEDLGLGLHAEEVLAPLDAGALITDLLWPPSAAGGVTEAVRPRSADRFNVVC